MAGTTSRMLMHKKYLQVKNNQGGNSVNVEIGTGTGVRGQKWYVTNTSDGYFTLKNGNGYMLDVQYGANNDGTRIFRHILQTMQMHRDSKQLRLVIPMHMVSLQRFPVVRKH